MFKYVIAAIMAFFAITANAQHPNEILNAFNKLSQEDKTQMLSLVKEKAFVEPTTAQQIGTMGYSIGLGIAEAAKGIGVASSDFLNTAGGKMVAAFIAVKLVGPIFAHIFGGIFIIAAGLLMVRFLVARMTQGSITYNTEIKNWRGNHPIKMVQKTALAGDAAFGYSFLTLIVLIVGGVVFGTV